MNNMNDDDFTAREEKPDYEMPDTGSCQAVCAQLHNIGHQKFGNEVSDQPQIVLIFELNQKKKDGKFAGEPFTLAFQGSKNISAASKLGKFIQSWRGKPFTEDERKGFDLRKLVGANAEIFVTHEVGKDMQTRPKIGSIGPLKGGVQKMVPTVTETPAWINKKKSEAVAPPQRAYAMAGAPPAPDEENLPF